MALLCSRLLTRNIRNPVCTPSRLYASSKLPSQAEIATGRELCDMQLRQQGVDDPYHMKAIKRGPNSKSSPIMVPSYFDCRIVGCICDEDSSKIVWMWLFKGEPRRCQCGHWLQLESHRKE